jgi:uracil-DNA glycosylase
LPPNKFPASNMPADDATLARARRMIAQRLESLERAGVQQLGRLMPGSRNVESSPASAAGASQSRASDLPRPLAGAPVAPDAPPSTESPAMPRLRPAPQPAASPASLLNLPYPRDLPLSADGCQLLLDKENEKVRPCTLCKELARTRTQTVYGVGNPRARVVFFGEAPGADEDRQGEPFVGRAGQLLTKIIEACGWKRDDVYILNVLKCRPPENRNPLPPEVDNCRQYFERQFEIVRPEFIVCVGTVPAQALLETTETVGRLRGRLHRYRDSKVLVTYHPSYLLRNPSAKKYVWDDMQFLLKEMGLPIPGKPGGG